MAKVQVHQIDKKKRYEIIGDFYDIVTSLKSKKEVIGFFMGLLTSSEALMFARRIQIARMLLDGKNYDDVTKELKVGVATVANVARWLYGDNDNFRKKIQEHKKQKEKRKKTDSKKYYNSILDRYPQHRILKDILGL